ncbi:folate receptor gamma [Hydra vulgaris]|uniref:folate receptor gamma n=1 Tax=Hydra vulgaris TaxID=6087 RepID=UPI001F5ED111|nr:folate receptor gamma [Hydra vulgaris]
MKMWIFYVTFIVFITIACGNNIESFLNKCISSKYHKAKPSYEGRPLNGKHCQYWNNNSCCTWNTTSKIEQDGHLSLHGIIWDQCPQKNMSEKCWQHFMQDTCFYECSPNLGPWIQVDTKSKKTRKERILNVPLCASDCDKWYDDCFDDYTCNDNWETDWNWSMKGTINMCPKECKKFGDYFKSSKDFCEKLFNYSFKYEKNKDKCMRLAPEGDYNNLVALKEAERLAKENNAIVQKTNIIYIIITSVFACMLIKT